MSIYFPNAVASRSTTTPPTTPLATTLYIVPSNASGSWASYPNKLAQYINSAWTYYTAPIGWPLFVTDEKQIVVWDGTAWELPIANIIASSSLGVANGVATLDSNGYVPTSQLPFVGGVSSVNSKTGDVTLSASDFSAVSTSLVGAANGVATLDSSGLLPLSQAPSSVISYDISGFYSGKPTASATVLYLPLVRSFTLPLNLSGSQGLCKTLATSSTTFSLQKNGTEFGTMVFSSSSAVATFMATAAVSFVAGDILAVIAPSTADSTLADMGFMLKGTVV